MTDEEHAELQLSQKHIVRLVLQTTGTQTSSVLPVNPNRDAQRVTIENLLRYALHMRPGYILLSEGQGNEMAEMLRAMWTGSSASLLTPYAHSLRDCLTRLEMFCLPDNNSNTVSLTLLRFQIAAALDVMVFVSSLRDGSHKVLNIAEIQGVRGDAVKLQSIFHYDSEMARVGAQTIVKKEELLHQVAFFRHFCLS